MRDYFQFLRPGTKCFRSPWWLLSRNKQEKAARALRRLGYAEDEIDSRLATIKLTLDKVRRETDGVTFVECFRKSNLRRTMIAVVPLSIQALSGISFTITYSTYYIQLAGYTPSSSFKISIASVVLGMLGNIGSWFLVDRVGRRDLSIYGLAGVTILLMVSGGLGTYTTNISCVKGVIALWNIYGFIYNLSIGATAYIFLTEIATARLRAKTASIGYALQSALYVSHSTSYQENLSADSERQTMWSFVLPYLFNPNEANLGAKTAFIFGGLSLISLAYLWLFQPETRGRTYEELDEMFTKHVRTRNFKSYQTEIELNSL